MLTTSDLSAELQSLATAADKLAQAVGTNGDLPALVLAKGAVETSKLQARLHKLGEQLAVGKGHGDSEEE